MAGRHARRGLIVEDEAKVAGYLKAGLSEEGWVVGVPIDGWDAAWTAVESGRVEMRRGVGEPGLSAVASFVWRDPNKPTSHRFHILIIEPDARTLHISWIVRQQAQRQGASQQQRQHTVSNDRWCAGQPLTCDTL